MTWSVFNFSLIFTENPEGNSYYLNTAILKYNQSLSIFQDTTYKGRVVAKTQKGWNYYFTPLGKAWVCRRAEDQGTLNLYDEDDIVIGNMTLYNIKVQPFVKRAKGDWGEELHCLNRETQLLRENVVPYMTSLIFIFGVVIVIAAYGIFRQFFSKPKTADYGMYDESGDVAGGGVVQMDEFTAPESNDEFANFNENQANFSNEGEPVKPKPAAPAANPFKKETNVTTNPFNQ